MFWNDPWEARGIISTSYNSLTTVTDVCGNGQGNLPRIHPEMPIKVVRRLLSMHMGRLHLPVLNNLLDSYKWNMTKICVIKTRIIWETSRHLDLKVP